MNEQYNGREINQKNTEANKGLSPAEGALEQQGAYKLLSHVAAPDRISTHESHSAVQPSAAKLSTRLTFEFLILITSDKIRV